MINKIKNNKLLIVILILIIILVILLVSKFAFAYLEAMESTSGVTSGEIESGTERFFFTNDEDLALMATTDNFSSADENLNATVHPKATLIANIKTKTTTKKYSTGINIKTNTFNYSEDGKAELILTVIGPNGEIVKTSADKLEFKTIENTKNGKVEGFDVTNKTGIFNIVVDKEITSTNYKTGKVDEWTYTLTFINYEYDQSLNENASFDADVIIQEEKIIPVYVETLNTLLADANKDGQFTLYHHNAEDLTDPNMENQELIADDDSYRYSGGNDVVHNYVCFGGDCSNDVGDPGYKNLYRIIGLFKNDAGKYEMKIIKADYANSDLLGKGANTPGETVNYETDGSYYTTTTFGPKLNSKNNHEEQDAFSHRYRGSLEAVDRYRWQENGSQGTTADWPKALLNTAHLNHNFLNSFDTTWQNKITNHDWKYKGNTWEEIAIGSKNSAKTIKNVYDHELGTNSDPTTYNAKIGLMYVSDYLYAASPNNWIKWPCNGVYVFKENGVDADNVPTGTYDGTDGTDYRDAIDENWMYMGLWEWTITQRTDLSGGSAFDVVAPGNVGSDYVGTRARVVRPSFYLSSDAKIINGSGTETDPYKLAV